MKNISARQFFGSLAIIATGFFSAQAVTAAPHSTLMSNCGQTISLDHPGATMTLAKKSRKGADFRLWIDVSISGNNMRAYCEGKTRTGEIERFGIGSGEWQSGDWISGADEVVREYVANK